MKEIDRTCLIQAVRSKARSRSIISCPLAMLLCFISGVMGLTFLFDGTLHVRAEQRGQKSVEQLSPTVMNRRWLVPFGRALTKSGPSEDHLWRERKGNGFYRALSLNEIAQREMLRQVPMELTKEARQTQVVLSLPMPDGSLARFRIEESPDHPAQFFDDMGSQLNSNSDVECG